MTKSRHHQYLNGFLFVLPELAVKKPLKWLQNSGNILFNFSFLVGVLPFSYAQPIRQLPFPFSFNSFLLFSWNSKNSQHTANHQPIEGRRTMKRVILTLGVVGLFALAYSTADAVLPDDIVLFMAFDERAGTDVRDSSIYGNDGVATTASWTDGKYRGGYEFDGATTAITVEASDVLKQLKAPMSIGYWIKIISFPVQWQAVAEMEAMPGNRTNGWKAGLNNGNPVFTTYGVKDHNAAGSIEIGQWTHFACTYDGATVTFYINGEVDIEVEGAGDINVTQSPRLNIGAEAGTPGNWSINAVLDNLWISNVAKTQAEVQQLMRLESPTSVEPISKASTTWGSLKL